MKVSLQHAWDILREVKLLTSVESVSINQAAGRVAFTEVRAANDSPPFDLSRFDGFAIGNDGQPSSHKTYKILTQEAVTAGDAKRYTVSTGEALPIMTGAPLPRGTSMVIPREECVVTGNFLKIKRVPEKDRMVLQKGADFTRGETYLEKGQKINPIHAAFLALDGKSKVEVFALPSIGVLSLGDELENISKKHLKTAKIRNSHPALIQSIISPYGNVVYQGIVEDDLEKIKGVLKDLLHSDIQVIVTTGGMGKGIKDLTRNAICGVGAETLLEGIDAIPIGTFSCYQYRDKVIFSFPGGMIGVLLLADLFLKPFVKKMQGISMPGNVGPFIKAILINDNAIPKEIPFGRGHNTRRTIKFLKARLWKKAGKKYVTPLQKGESLLHLNSFILLKFPESMNNKNITVFPLWNSEDD